MQMRTKPIANAVSNWLHSLASETSTVAVKLKEKSKTEPITNDVNCNMNEKKASKRSLL